jgi:hypothetical protein
LSEVIGALTQAASAASHAASRSPWPRAAAASQYDAAPLAELAPSSFHSIEDALIHVSALDLRLPPRVGVDGARPPVEQPFARVESHVLRPGQHRSKHRRRGARRSLEEQRLAEADDEHAPLHVVEAIGIDPPQAIAGADQIVGGGALAIALEVGTGRDQIGAIGLSRDAARFLGRGDGIGELALVVEHTRARQRIFRIGRCGLRGDDGSRQQADDDADD